MILTPTKTVEITILTVMLRRENHFCLSIDHFSFYWLKLRISFFDVRLCDTLKKVPQNRDVVIHIWSIMDLLSSNFFTHCRGFYFDHSVVVEKHCLLRRGVFHLDKSFLSRWLSWRGAEQKRQMAQKCDVWLD